MKQYFAKYLPVEGKIEEGDLFITEFGEGPVNHIKGEPIFETDKKVKLFLLSNDIQIGDSVQCKEFGNGYLNDRGYVQHEEVAVLKTLYNYYKIIGEISPEVYQTLKKVYDTLYPLIENPIPGELMDEIYSVLSKANPQK